MLALADALLYEGYLLYPYRRSSPKNRVRWQFGVLAPRAWAEAHGLDDEGVAGSAESWWQQTETLVEAAATASFTVRLRFLQVQDKQVERRERHGRYRPVDRLEADGTTNLSFTEACPRELTLTCALGDLSQGGQRFQLRVAGNREVAPLLDHGRVAGRVVRRRRPLRVDVLVAAEALAPPRWRLRLRTANGDTELPPGAARDEALRAALVATHTLVEIDGGRFCSLLEPPAEAAGDAAACRNVHTFPVLVGEVEDPTLVLSSPILLYDYPAVAPESPGDLFDGGEIDEILSLRTLTLTDEEKREARATDPRAAALVERVEQLSEDALGRLHGTIRSLAPVAPAVAAEPGEAAWWEPGGDDGLAPERDHVLIGGVAVRAGSSVRLRPRLRGADPQDMFLVGRLATVRRVLCDVDGDWQVAVTLADDPFAELCGTTGRFRYFRLDEVEAVADAAGPP